MEPISAKQTCLCWNSRKRRDGPVANTSPADQSRTEMLPGLVQNEVLALRRQRGGMDLGNPTLQRYYYAFLRSFGAPIRLHLVCDRWNRNYQTLHATGRTTTSVLLSSMIIAITSCMINNNHHFLYAYHALSNFPATRSEPGPAFYP